MSEKFLLKFKHSYTIVPFVVLIAMILVYINSRIEDKEVETKVYAKISLLVAFISIFSTYINKIPGKIYEEIMTGPPPF